MFSQMFSHGDMPPEFSHMFGGGMGGRGQGRRMNGNSTEDLLSGLLGGAMGPGVRV